MKKSEVESYVFSQICALQKKMKTEDTHLVWTDDKVQLVLEIINDFKTKALVKYAGVDWKA